MPDADANAPGILLSPDDRFQAFTLPVATQPRVSVIIAAQEKPGWAVASLCAIAQAGAATPFEVIVVTGHAGEHLQGIGGLRVVDAVPGASPYQHRNTGARAARGELLVFMDEHAQPTPGWLDALCDCIDHETDCGMAGSRLVGENGRLVGAGGIIYTDGTCAEAGQAEHRDDPRYRCRRDVDYLPGAALMIRRRLFESIGGFNVEYAQARWRDADLALCVRAAGQRVVYEPRSVVLCADIAPPVKPERADGQSDRQAFVGAWVGELAHQPSPGAAAHAVLWRRKPHILVIDASTPDPARDTASRRLAIMFQLLRHLGWKASFLPADGQAAEAQVDQLGTLGVSVWRQPFVRDPSVWLRAHGASLDAVMLCRCDVATTYLPLARRHAPHARIVFDTVDLRFPRELRAAELSGNAALARQAQLSGERELALVEASDATLAADPAERDLIAAHVASAHVELVSSAMHMPCAPVHELAGRRGMVFIGSRRQPLNVDPLQWLVRGILPCVRQDLPDIELHLFRVSAGLPDTLAAAPGIHIHDRDNDLETWLSQARLMVAPIRYGSGMMGRVNMAMSRGVPVVATTIAVAGMGLVDGQNVLIGEDTASFAAAIARLSKDDALWMRLSSAGLENVDRHFSVRSACAALRRTLSV